MTRYVILRQLSGDERYSLNTVDADSARQAIELWVSDLPDHLLEHPFLVFPAEQARRFMAKGHTKIERSVAVEADSYNGL